MASVKKRPRGKWRARVRDASGKEHAKHFERKVDAERWLVDQQSKVNRGAWVDPALGRTTVAEWAPTWLASKAGLKPTSRKSYEIIYQRHVEPHWGNVPLAQVTYRTPSLGLPSCHRLERETVSYGRRS